MRLLVGLVMFIGYLKMNLFIAHSRSLKDKRRVTERLKQRVKNNFNVSVAEKPSNKWQVCELVFTCVNYTRQYVSGALDRLEDFIRFDGDISILEVEKGIL